ncbi:MAG: hypothetical protein ACTJH7_00375 [Alcaligenes sp.]
MGLKKSDEHAHKLGAMIGLTKAESHFICEKEEFLDGSGWRIHFSIETPAELKRKVFKAGQTEPWIDIPKSFSRPD